MLKIQELQLDGIVFRVREPRLYDFFEARKGTTDEYILRMLSGMLIDEEGKPLGMEAVSNLPLRFLDPLSKIVMELTDQGGTGPLTQSGGSSSA